MATPELSPRCACGTVATHHWRSCIATQTFGRLWWLLTQTPISNQSPVWLGCRETGSEPGRAAEHHRSTWDAPHDTSVAPSVCSRPPPSVVATGDSTAHAPPVEVSQPAAPRPLHGKAVRCRCPRRRRRRLRQARRRRCNSGRTSGWSRRFQSAAGRARLWELWWARCFEGSACRGQEDRTRTMFPSSCGRWRAAWFTRVSGRNCLGSRTAVR
jgi:hypothetical protein